LEFPLGLPLLADPPRAFWNLLAPGLGRGILLGVVGLGGSLVSGEGAAGEFASDPGSDTQSSDRESSQACPMAARGEGGISVAVVVAGGVVLVVVVGRDGVATRRAGL